jgi:ribosomal protein L11 methyltransferase
VLTICADLISKKNFYVGKADIVVANITADILKRLASSVGEILKDEGVIIISGIIKERLEEVKRAYSANGFTPVKELNLGDWSALALRRVEIKDCFV